jgi:hypothetical protein
MRYSPVQATQSILAQQLNLLAGDATGSSNLLAHQTLGLFALGTNPTTGKTITLTINAVAVTITFVAAIGSTPGNVLIQGTAAATVAAILNLLANPQVTNANQVALASANQTLVAYLDYDQSGTNLAVSSVNNSTYAPLTTFTASTNITGGTWTASTMKLYVEDGIGFINGTEVYFTGGMTPLVTAPVSHPRVDLLTIDNAGILAWVTGVEGTSPATPTYPNNKIVICELWNVVGETQLLDNLNQSAAQGFIFNDTRPFLQNAFMPLAFGSNFIPDGDGARDLGSATFEWGNIYAKNGIFLNGISINSQITTGVPAGPSFTQAQPAVIAPFQSDGGIGYDTSGGQLSNSFSVTVGANSNRMLVVFVYPQTTGATCSAVTYGGVAMTLIDTKGGLQNSTTAYIFILPAPTTGSNTLAVTVSSGTAAVAYYSIYNASQSTTPDAHSATSYSNTGGTISLVTVTNGALVFAALINNGAFTGNAAFEHAINVSAGSLSTADSGNVFPAGTSINAINGSTGGNTRATLMIAIAPITSVSYKAVVASSAAPTSQFYNLYSSFFGFAASSITGGTTGTFVEVGIANGFSGLAIGAQYYLNDTSGTIGTSPGTNSRKVGIAMSATTLLVTNIW